RARPAPPPGPGPRGGARRPPPAAGGAHRRARRPTAGGGLARRGARRPAGALRAAAQGDAGPAQPGRGAAAGAGFAAGGGRGPRRRGRGLSAAPRALAPRPPLGLSPASPSAALAGHLDHGLAFELIDDLLHLSLKDLVAQLVLDLALHLLVEGPPARVLPLEQAHDVEAVLDLHHG